MAGLAADQGGSAPRRVAAPVPRAKTGAAGSPARTRMLIAALWSACARNPQAPHANTACDGRFDLAVCPHWLQACESQIDSRTGLLQGKRRWDRFYGLDGVVLDADTNAARNILARLYDDEITLYTPFREVKRLLRDRSGTTVGTAPPGLESAQAAQAA